MVSCSRLVVGNVSGRVYPDVAKHVHPRVLAFVDVARGAQRRRPWPELAREGGGWGIL